jgi:hypothetical protein
VTVFAAVTTQVFVAEVEAAPGVKPVLLLVATPAGWFVMAFTYAMSAELTWVPVG